MKSLEEIKNNPRLRNFVWGEDGFSCEIGMAGWRGSLICSTGAGWEHVSVSPYKHRIVPEWDDMCKIKDIFWNDDEAVIQIHPPKAEYVNNQKNCLHLRRCTYKEMVLPPSILVGVRKGQTKAEVMKEIEEAYKMAKQYDPEVDDGSNN